MKIRYRTLVIGAVVALALAPFTASPAQAYPVPPGGDCYQVFNRVYVLTGSLALAEAAYNACSG